MIFGTICLGSIMSILLLAFAEPIEGGFSCIGKANGDYRNPNNCYGFISCSNGIEYKMPCPAGLKFNEKTDECDYNVPCYQDGGWSAWSAWSVCSVTCGEGHQYRTRTCTNPPPSGGGKNCTGPRTEFRTCIQQSCPGSFCKGKWNGDYTDPNNPFGFITCSNGLIYYRNCPAGLRFNQAQDKCL
ncbi:mucin-like protein [Montipora capricornis]|uniref:mucin-like protein n=1 Tax=Montipora capricornis TaxID=246305 RepID=UPI0035F202E6